jgi:hypothetical protein
VPGRGPGEEDAVAPVGANGVRLHLERTAGSVADVVEDQDAVTPVPGRVGADEVLLQQVGRGGGTPRHLDAVPAVVVDAVVDDGVAAPAHVDPVTAVGPQGVAHQVRIEAVAEVKCQ